jgi:hypothetical protein
MNLAVFAFCLNFQKRADRPVGLLNPRKRTSSPNTLKVCFWPIADLTTKSRVSRQLRYYKRIWRPEDLARMGKDRFAGCFVHKPLPSIKPTMSRLTRNKPRRKRGRLRRAVAGGADRGTFIEMGRPRWTANEAWSETDIYSSLSRFMRLKDAVYPM